jgi:trimethylamine:corrinoid methyltransferase-like protein
MSEEKGQAVSVFCHLTSIICYLAPDTIKNDEAHQMDPNVTERQVAEKIHNAAMALLKDPGIKLDHDEICKALLDAGAQKGVSANVIRFPKELVAEKLTL